MTIIPEVRVNEKLMTIWKWWATRVAAGCQLRDVDEWQEGYDYKEQDNNGWLTWVATEVLMAEYNREHPENPISHSSFTHKLRLVLCESRVRPMDVTLKIGDFKERQMRSLMLFKPCRWYADNLYSRSYYSCFR